MDQHDWLCLQLLDSAFPSGGFTHSNGLEAAAAAGIVASYADLDAFVEEAIRQHIDGVCPFIGHVCSNPDDFEWADRRADALMTNHVANRASRKQGRALLRCCASVLGLPKIQAVHGDVRDRSLPAHHGPVWGLLGHELGLGPVRARSMSVYVLVRGILSAATRLNIVGPMAAQRLQIEITDRAVALAQTEPVAAIDDAAWSSPLLDLVHASHDRLYSRLFQT